MKGNCNNIWKHEIFDLFIFKKIQNKKNNKKFGNVEF